MTQISMDPQVMTKHAEAHELVAEEAKKALNKTPRSIDAGLGSDAVATIVAKLVDPVDAVYRVHGTLGALVRGIANDATKTEEDVSASISRLADEVEDDK